MPWGFGSCAFVSMEVWSALHPAPLVFRCTDGAVEGNRKAWPPGRRRAPPRRTHPRRFPSDMPHRRRIPVLHNSSRTTLRVARPEFHNVAFPAADRGGACRTTGGALACPARTSPRSCHRATTAGPSPSGRRSLGVGFRSTRDHPLTDVRRPHSPALPTTRPDPAAAGRGKGRPQADPEGTRSALSVEGPRVNWSVPPAPGSCGSCRARSRGQGGAPHWTNDLDRGEDRHTMTAVGGRVSVVGR
jgi:hypothetical protein